MIEKVVIVLAILVGLWFCFRGHSAMRFVLAAWGGLLGFVVGWFLVAPAFGPKALGGWADLVVGLVLALIFAALSYGFYVLGVLIGLGSMGYGLGLAIASVLHVTGAVQATLLGLAVAAALVVLALVTNLPKVLLVILSALSGAGVAVGGLILLVATLNPKVSSGALAQQLTAGQLWWDLLWLGLSVAGIVVQFRSRIWASPRSQWGPPTPARA